MTAMINQDILKLCPRYAKQEAERIAKLQAKTQLNEKLQQEAAVKAVMAAKDNLKLIKNVKAMLLRKETTKCK